MKFWFCYFLILPALFARTNLLFQRDEGDKLNVRYCKNQEEVNSWDECHVKYEVVFSHESFQEKVKETYILAPITKIEKEINEYHQQLSEKKDLSVGEVDQEMAILLEMTQKKEAMEKDWRVIYFRKWLSHLESRIQDKVIEREYVPLKVLIDTLKLTQVHRIERDRNIIIPPEEMIFEELERAEDKKVMLGSCALKRFIDLDSFVYSLSEDINEENKAFVLFEVNSLNHLRDKLEEALDFGHCSVTKSLLIQELDELYNRLKTRRK